MKQRFLPLIFLLLITLVYNGVSQEEGIGESPITLAGGKKPIYVGPVLGFNRSLHTVSLKSFSDDALCPVFENGSQNGFYAGLSIEYLLGDAKDSKSSIIAKFLYNRLPASLEVSGDEYPSRVRLSDGTEREITSITDHKQEINYDLITFEVFYKLNLFDTPFGITVGPTIDFAMSKEQTQTMELIEPLNAQFVPDDDNPDVRYSDDLRTIYVKEGDIENSASTRFGIKAGVQWEINMQGWYIVPHAHYNFGITNLTSAEDWRVNAFQVGVDARWALRIL